MKVVIGYARYHSSSKLGIKGNILTYLKDNEYDEILVDYTVGEWRILKYTKLADEATKGV